MASAVCLDMKGSAQAAEKPVCICRDFLSGASFVCLNMSGSALAADKPVCMQNILELGLMLLSQREQLRVLAQVHVSSSS